MIDRRYTLLIDDGVWRLSWVSEGSAVVVPIAFPEEADVLGQAQSVVQQMEEQGGAGGVMLALPSHWCLAAVIDTNGLGRSNRRQAMGYLLEEHLPISAEDSVADFIEWQGQALGVAVDVDRLSPIVDAFQQLGVSVETICPASLLAVAGLAKQYADSRAVAIRSGQGIDFVELSQRGKPASWRWFTDVSEWMDGVSKSDSSFSEEAGHCLTLGIQAASAASDLSLKAVDGDGLGVDQTVTLTSDQVLAGECSAWIDLRRDALETPDRSAVLQKQLGLIAAGLAFFLLCVIGATFWRAEQYKAYADEKNADQIAVFKEAMPGQHVPQGGSIISRLKSEQRRLAGLGGQLAGDSGSGTNPLQPTSALVQMHTLLTAWPESLRYRISDFTIEPKLVRMNGQAPDSVIPEKLAAALRATGDYEVDPPNTRALNDFGFTFGFIARPVTPDDQSNQERLEGGS